MTYFALFIWSFLAATIVPVGSEPLLVATVRDSGHMLVPVGIASLGNCLGAMTLYWMGLRAGRIFAERISRARGGPGAVRLLARYGRPALVLSWIPVLGDLLVGLAGAAGLGFVSVAGWIIAGKLARYTAVAWIALSV